MILHCSQKLAARIPEVSATPLADDSPLGGWHGHLFHMDRRQCLMLCHDATRYVLFLPGLRKPDFARLGEIWIPQLFSATLALLGCPDRQIEKAERVLGPLHCDTTVDRSVQGSLRVAIQDLEALLWEVPNVLELDPMKASCWLNQRPSTIRGRWVHPDRDMLHRIAGL